MPPRGFLPSRRVWTMNVERLSIENVTKAFGGVPAVRNVSLDVMPGETLALLGENGAGKSTLMKVVAGVYPHGTYEGTIRLGEREVHFHNVRQAEDDGVVLVPQELHVAPNLSIAENMFMGALPRRYGVVDRRRLRERTRERLAFFEMKADPDAAAATLSPSEQRLMMISAALAKSAAKVLILDEPTASLTEGEARHLFEKMEQVRKTGVVTVYITHRLDEIESVCDRAVVMRNGEVVLVSSEVKGKRREFVRAMIGRDAQHQERTKVEVVGSPLLSVRNLTVEGGETSARAHVSDASLDVRAGEIVGLFGLVGAGRTELAKAVFGAWPGKVHGDVLIDGVSGRPASPREAIGRGLGMLTEDRKRSGIIEGQSALFNMSAASIGAVSRMSVISSTDERNRAMALARELALRPMRLDLPVENFWSPRQAIHRVRGRDNASSQPRDSPVVKTMRTPPREAWLFRDRGSLRRPWGMTRTRWPGLPVAGRCVPAPIPGQCPPAGQVAALSLGLLEGLLSPSG